MIATTQKSWRNLQSETAESITKKPAVVRHSGDRGAHHAYVSETQAALDHWIDNFSSALKRVAWDDEFVTFAIREENETQLRVDLGDRNGACSCTTAPFAWRTMTPERAAARFVSALRGRRLL